MNGRSDIKFLYIKNHLMNGTSSVHGFSPTTNQRLRES